MATKLPQTITYWTASGNNGTGGKTWVAGKEISARIAVIAAEAVFDTEGKEYMAHKAVYADTALAYGTYLVEGKHSGVAAPVTAAQMVVFLSSNPTMSSLNRMLL